MGVGVWGDLYMVVVGGVQGRTVFSVECVRGMLKNGTAAPVDRQTDKVTTPASLCRGMVPGTLSLRAGQPGRGRMSGRSW